MSAAAGMSVDSRREWRRQLVWFLPVVVIALAAYARSFTSEFQYDDQTFVLDSEAIREPTWSKLIVWGRSRIIPVLTLALNYQIGGIDPLSYHIFNFIIHVLTCAVLFRLALELCRTPRLRGSWLAQHDFVFALGSALLFACHPIQIQAVTYVVQRMSSLAALFYLSSVLFYVIARNARSEGKRSGPAYIAALGCALAAFLSKENTATLPLAILLAEWIFFRGHATASQLGRLAPFLLMVLIIPIAWRLLPGRTPLPLPPGQSESWISEQFQLQLQIMMRGVEPAEGASPLAYFLTQTTVIPRYLGLVFVPWGFNIDHDIPLATEITPPVMAGFLLLLALLSFGLYATTRWPVVGFGILWIFLGLAVESSFLPIRDVMNEHRMYLPMAGVALIAGNGLAWVARAHPRMATVVGALVVVTLTALTIARNEVWRTQLSLWQDALSKSPGKSRVHVNVGTALHLAGRTKEAIPYYCAALKLDPNNPRAESNINIALEELMESGEAELEVHQIGDDGTVELVPRHPCPTGR